MRKLTCLILLFLTVFAFAGNAKASTLIQNSSEVILAKGSNFSKPCIISHIQIPVQVPNSHKKKKRIKANSYDFLMTFKNELTVIYPKEELLFAHCNPFILPQHYCIAKRGPPSLFFIL